MKKTLSILAGLALSGATATAATILSDVSLQTTTANSFNPSTNTNGGNFSGFAAKLNSDWLAATQNGTALSNNITGFTLQTLTVDQRRDSTTTNSYYAFNSCKLAIRDNSSSNFIAVSNTSTISDGKVSFTFDSGGLQLDMNTNYSFFFVSDSTTLNGNGITGGSFIKQQVATYSNADADTTDTTTGLATDSNTGLNGNYKAVITFTGLATVPEPATASLSLLGLGALCLRRRRK